MIVFGDELTFLRAVLAARYFLDCDDDAHYYLVPENKRDEWNAWRAIPSDDERSWDVPDFARRINNWTSITFIDPQEKT